MGQAPAQAERFEVLVVEDDLSLQLALVRAIDRTETLKGRGVSGVSEAKKLIGRRPPDVMITDLRLGENCGLELISFLDHKSPGTPVIIVSGYRSVFEEELLHHPGLKVLEKPVSLGVLRDEILRHTASLESKAVQRPSRELSFQISDYLQLASLGHRTLALRVQTENGKEGKVEIVEGEIWSARLGANSGREALHELVRNATADIEWEALNPLPENRELFGSTEHFLLDLAREDDEASRDKAEAFRDVENIAEEPLGFGEIFAIEKDHPAPPDLSEPVSILCRQLVSRVAGGRVAAVISLNERRMVGGASRNRSLSPEIQEVLADAVVGLCRERGILRLEEAFSREGEVKSGEAEMRELRIYLSETVYFMVALDDLNYVAVLVAEPFLKQGLGWMALKEAIPGLLASLEI